MDTLDLRCQPAAVTLTKPEAILLCAMAQHWVKELPRESPQVLELSEQLGEVAYRFDVLSA
jgi:hypothetical protein